MVKSLGGVDWHYFTVENLHIYLYMCIHKIYIHKYDLKSYKEFFWHQFKFFSIIKYNMVILLFSHSVMSDSLQPHVLQHAMLPCPSLPPRACSNSRPSSQWYHLTISSSVMPSPPSSFPTSGSFPVELAFCIRWSKYWSFSFNISPSNEYSELISLRIDWFDLLAVQETLKSLLQHHSPKASWQIDRETMEIVTDFISLGFKIIADDDCSHEIKRCLLLGHIGS